MKLVAQKIIPTHLVPKFHLFQKYINPTHPINTLKALPIHIPLDFLIVICIHEFRNLNWDGNKQKISRRHAGKTTTTKKLFNWKKRERQKIVGVEVLTNNVLKIFEH